MAAAKGKAHNNIIDSLPKKIKDKIYDLRENKSMSHSQISKEVGLAVTTVGKYCRKFIDTKPLPPAPNGKKNYTMRRKKNPQYTKEQIQELADDLIEWADTAKDIHIAGWSRKHKKTTPWLHELCKLHPQIAKAKDEAMVLLGKKVLNSSFYGQGNATVGMAYLPIYDKDFKALLEWKAKLSQQSSESIKTTFTEMKNAISDGSLLEMLKQHDESK